MSRNARVAGVLMLGALVGGLLGAWLLSGRVAPPAAIAVPMSSASSPKTSEPLVQAAEIPVQRARATPPGEPSGPAARGGENDEALDHRHPITPQHEALRTELQLVAALNDALDLRDAAGMRALLARYDALSPEDPLRLAEGYERAADCIEARDPGRQASARANAQRYYDDARGSTLRRHVRRLCLENNSEQP